MQIAEHLFKLCCRLRIRSRSCTYYPLSPVLFSWVLHVSTDAFNSKLYLDKLIILQVFIVANFTKMHTWPEKYHPLLVTIRRYSRIKSLSFYWPSTQNGRFKASFYFIHKYRNLQFAKLTTCKISEFGISQWAKNHGIFQRSFEINKNIPGPLGPQKKYSSHATSSAEKACLSRMTPNWRMRKWNTELAYCRLSPNSQKYILSNIRLWNIPSKGTRAIIKWGAFYTQLFTNTYQTSVLISCFRHFVMLNSPSSTQSMNGEAHQKMVTVDTSLF